jgi:hypothetical protein
MEELQELHIKGKLSEMGYLKETYDNDKQDLKHELTALGKMELRDILKEPEMKREFLKMALEEAKKHSPEQGKKIVLAAINKLKELQ